jgi:hypothetical protein
MDYESMTWQGVDRSPEARRRWEIRILTERTHRWWMAIVGPQLVV